MIRETCSCGATTVVDYPGNASTSLRSDLESDAITAWRRDHRHEPPAPTPECDHVWIAWGNVTELIAEYRCQRCDARKQASNVVEPECDHEWVDESTMAAVDRSLVCARCGQRRTVKPGVILTPQHVHDWVPSPKDFYGPPRCRVCGMSDVTLGVPPDGVPSTDPAGGS